MLTIALVAGGSKISLREMHDNDNDSTLAKGQRSQSINDQGKDNCNASALMAAMTRTVAKATVTDAATTKKETWYETTTLDDDNGAQFPPSTAAIIMGFITDT